MLWYFRNKNADENNFARITIPKLLPHIICIETSNGYVCDGIFKMMILDPEYISKYKMKMCLMSIHLNVVQHRKYLLQKGFKVSEEYVFAEYEEVNQVRNILREYDIKGYSVSLVLRI